jgi:hypothetical protein
MEVFFLAGPMDDIEWSEGEAPDQFGGGIAYHFSPRIGTEFYYSRGSLDHIFQYPPDPETGDPGYVSRSEQKAQIFAGRVLIHFSKSRLSPYAAFGGALVNIRNKGRDRNFGQGPAEIFFDETRNRTGIDCGMGIKYHFTPAFTIRSELGSIMMESSLIKLTFLVSYHF